MCSHLHITITGDNILLCNDCGAKMSRVYWQWTISIGRRAETEPKPKVQIPASPPDPVIQGIPPWNDPRFDSVPSDDPASEKEPGVQA